MQPSDGDSAIRVGDRIARFVERHFLWLLVGCYVAAAVWPQPGLVMRAWQLAPRTVTDVPPSLSLFLLAIMLFIAAVLTDIGRIREVLQHPLVLCAAVLAVWLGPALLVFVAGWLVPWVIAGESAAALLVGLALVAAMPVANSSVGWTQSASGNLAVGLALVVASISLSPWATPQLLSWFGMSLSPGAEAYCRQLVTNFSGLFFIVWVLLPTAAGFAARYLITPRRLARASAWLALGSAAALLVLNYINSALALPKVLTSPTRSLLVTAVLAIALSLVGLAGGWLLARWLKLTDDLRTALMFGLSMKHTGLALILAGAVLKGQPLAILMIVLATLMQHLLAGIVQWCSRRGGPA